MKIQKRIGLIAVKKSMKHIFTEKGKMLPVTELTIDNCEIVGHRTLEKDGYIAVQVGACNHKTAKNINKPQRIYYEKNALGNKGVIREFRLESEDLLLPIATKLGANAVSIGDFLSIRGMVKGKGFAGVMKRYGFGGGNASHGASKAHRLAGSTGQCQDPGRIPKGAKMPGRMGGVYRTARYIKVVKVESDSIFVHGSVPGANGSVLVLSFSE